MVPIRIGGQVDDKHQLSVELPLSIPPGPVTVLILPASPEDDAGAAWELGVAEQWADELNDPRQDIYTVTDGDPICES